MPGGTAAPNKSDYSQPAYFFSFWFPITSLSFVLEIFSIILALNGLRSRDFLQKPLTNSFQNFPTIVSC